MRAGRVGRSRSAGRRRRGRGRRRASPGLAASGGWLPAAAAALALAGPLAGQRAELLPQVGFFTGLSSPGTAEDGDGREFRLGERESGFAYGIGVQLGSDTPAGVRASVLLGNGSDVPVRGPGCSEAQPCTVEQNVRAFTGALVVRPFPSLILVRPYLVVGGGWKRLGFDDADLEALDLDGAIDDQTKGAWQLGIGAEADLGVTRVIVELNDFISTFSIEDDRGDGDTQHDLFLTVGLRL